jgi:deoxyguanosine kinase
MAGQQVLPQPRHREFSEASGITLAAREVSRSNQGRRRAPRERSAKRATRRAVEGRIRPSRPPVAAVTSFVSRGATVQSRAMAIPSEGDVPLRHVAIDGPIGVGKTSLVELLARRFHGTKILEDVDNPFLPDFYKKKKGSAFQTQLFFLLSRYQQQRDLAQIDLFTTLVVADYHFPKDKIFACLNLDDSELMIYDRLYTLLSETVPKPDLVIYLQGSLETCMKRIKKASRSIEKGITPEYVAQLIEAYNYYFYHYEETPLLVVDTNEIDFVNRPADFDDLVAQVQKAKKGVQYYVPAAHS